MANDRHLHMSRKYGANAQHIPDVFHSIVFPSSAERKRHAGVSPARAARENSSARAAESAFFPNKQGQGRHTVKTARGLFTIPAVAKKAAPAVKTRRRQSNSPARTTRENSPACAAQSAFFPNEQAHKRQKAQAHPRVKAAPDGFRAWNKTTRAGASCAHPGFIRFK